ncbi:MAG: HAMP domain-containing protein [Deltaproteobacteria bacterium]|nr:HAMP domain-containing protein [Deltaproteobacteria bacterium]
MKSMTIRGKIITVFAIFLTCVGALTIFDWWSIVTIQQKVTVSEFFEDMFNNILEARRYEKNFLFYHDRRSLDENLVYINKAIDISTNINKDIERVAGKEYHRFQLDLNDYKSMIETFVAQQDSIVTEKQDESIRLKGKAIGDFAEKLLSLKRKRIHLALDGILGLPFVFLAIFVVLSMLIAQLLFNRILNPLALIRRTIDRVALGDLSPIDYEENAKDEISMLIYAFNRMAGELESKQEQLVQSRKIAAIGTFTAGIAHELNNPINNIYLTAESILEDYDTLSESEGRELVSDVLSQAERAGEIIKNLLDFSRNELPSFTDLDINEVIQKSLKLVKNQTMLAGIQVSTSFFQDLPNIRGNFRNLEQVFLNLLINAIQSMSGGGSITIRTSRESEKHLKIMIQDTGTGIRPEYLEHIFEPFYTTKAVGRGTGLGLSVTYALVKRHGGYIEVQSQVNVGTTFSVYLPIPDSGGQVL